MRNTRPTHVVPVEHMKMLAYPHATLPETSRHNKADIEWDDVFEFRCEAGVWEPYTMLGKKLEEPRLAVVVVPIRKKPTQ